MTVACSNAPTVYFHRWKTLGQTCAKMFRGFESADMPIFCHGIDVEYARHLPKWSKVGLDVDLLDVVSYFARNV